MISQENWEKLKNHESYGMYTELYKKIDVIAEKIVRLHLELNNQAQKIREIQKKGGLNGM